MTWKRTEKFCSKCSGTGKINGKICPICKGKGFYDLEEYERRLKEKEVEVKKDEN